MHKLRNMQDCEVRKAFQRSLQKQGFKFKLSTKVTNAEVVGDSVQLTGAFGVCAPRERMQYITHCRVRAAPAVEPAKGGSAETMETEVVLVSTGAAASPGT